MGRSRRFVFTIPQRHPGLCFAGGSSGTLPSRVQSKIAEAQKYEKQGELNRALTSLICEAKIQYQASDGDKAAGQRCLAEAKSMFVNANNPQNHHENGLLIANLLFEVDKAEALALISKILGQAETVQEPDSKDAIRFRVSSCYAILGEMEKAIALVDRIESPLKKSWAFESIANSFLRQKDRASAIKALLASCAVTEAYDIKEVEPRRTRVDRLINAAKKLFELGETVSAEALMDQAIDCIPQNPLSRNPSYGTDDDRLQEIAIFMLDKLGKREKAIKTIIKGWDDFENCSPELIEKDMEYLLSCQIRAKFAKALKAFDARNKI